MKTLANAILAALCVLLASCAAPTFPVSGPAKELSLATSQERLIVGWMAGKSVVTFPAGRYVATYRTKAGTFYKAPADVFSGKTRLTDAGVLIVDMDGAHAFQMNELQRVIWRLDRPLEIVGR